jgi:two-component system LytT family response regulator
MRALIIDDEEASRDRLRRMLGVHAEIEIIGEAQDGPGAIEAIEARRPDLIFLDIQMPGCSGLEVAASLRAPRPRVIFCTAYDKYAVDAFELNAVDYLLKPVSRVRLAAALERVTAAAPETLEGALDGAQAASGHPTRFLGKRGARFRVVPVVEVLCFVSDGGLTKLQGVDDYYWMQPTLVELEQRLDPDQFIRISRAAIVRLDAVREVVPLGGSQGEVVMVDGTRLEISRRRYKPLLERLGAG